MTTFWERAESFGLPSLCILTYCTHFGFEGGTSVLTVSVPGHCFSFTFYNFSLSFLTFLFHNVFFALAFLPDFTPEIAVFGGKVGYPLML